MERQYVYRAKFKFEVPLKREKNGQCDTDDAEYFFNYEISGNPWDKEKSLTPEFKEDIAECCGKDVSNKIVSIFWHVLDADQGYVKVVSAEEFDDEALKDLSQWIKGQSKEFEDYDDFELNPLFVYNTLNDDYDPYDYDRDDDSWFKASFDCKSGFELRLFEVMEREWKTRKV